jgi:hypothetical protein
MMYYKNYFTIMENMKNDSNLYTSLITTVLVMFLVINLKQSIFDELWNYFSALIVFMLNFSTVITILRNKRNAKIVRSNNVNN